MRLDQLKAKIFDVYGYLFFILFAVMSLVDANSRILITDPAYYLFNMITDVGFFIPDNRYTAVINQVPVILGIKMNLPLSVLIPLYSVSFVFIRFVYFFLVNNIFKNKVAGLAIITFTMIGVADSYFRPTSESSIALLNSCLLYAILSYTDKSERVAKYSTSINTGATMLLVVFGYYTHSIALFSLLFVIIYFSLERNKLKSIYPYVAVLFTVALFSWKILVKDTSDHHQELYGNLMAMPAQVINDFSGYYPHKFFINYFKDLYWSLMLLFLFGTGFLLITRKWKETAFFILFMIMHYVVVCVSFKSGDANMQMEKIFLPLVMFSALVFFSSLEVLFKKNQMVLVIVSLLLVGYGVTRINKSRPVYSGRIEYLNEIVQKADKEQNRKLVISQDQINRKRILFSWAMGIETLMISSMEEDMKPLTVYLTDDIEQLEENMKMPNNFIPASFQSTFNQAGFNKNYFRLQEQEYIVWDAQFVD